MGTCMLDSVVDVRSLVGLAQSSDEPLVVYDGDDECLIAMRPAVFERLLFDTNILNRSSRETFCV